VSTPAQSRALEPEARRQRAVTSVGRKPSDGPRKHTVSLMVSVTIAGLTLPTELSALYQWASGVEGGGVMGSEMKDAAAHSSDGAEQGVAAGAAANDFASYSIFFVYRR